jgi:hypothetical protein
MCSARGDGCSVRLLQSLGQATVRTCSDVARYVRVESSCANARRVESAFEVEPVCSLVRFGRDRGLRVAYWCSDASPSWLGASGLGKSCALRVATR